MIKDQTDRLLLASAVKRLHRENDKLRAQVETLTQERDDHEMWRHENYLAWKRAEALLPDEAQDKMSNMVALPREQLQALQQAAAFVQAWLNPTVEDGEDTLTSEHARAILDTLEEAEG